MHAIEPRAVIVDPKNWETVCLFLQLHTHWQHQWRDKLGVNHWLGLDHTAVTSTLRTLRIKRRDEVYAQLMAMEFAALPILNGVDDD